MEINLHSYKIESAVSIQEKIHLRFRVEFSNYKNSSEEAITLHQNEQSIDIDDFEIQVCRVGFHSENVANVKFIKNIQTCLFGKYSK